MMDANTVNELSRSQLERLREEFEKWAGHQGLSIKRHDSGWPFFGAYTCETTEAGWQGFKAGRVFIADGVLKSWTAARSGKPVSVGEWNGLTHASREVTAPDEIFEMSLRRMFPEFVQRKSPDQ